MTKGINRLVVVVVGCVLLAALLFSCGKLLRVVGLARSLQASVVNLEARAQGDLLASSKTGELEQIRGELVQAGDELKALQAELGFVLRLAPHLGWLPVLGGDVAAIPDLLETAVGISSAAELTFEGLEPMLALFGGAEGRSSPESRGESLSAVLLAGRPQFAAAQAKLDVVRQNRERISEERLSPQVAGLVQRLDRYLSLLDSGVDVLLVLPELLGAEEPSTYLLLAQNENELRATGGFISSVALLRVADGRIEELDFRDSYAVDDLTRPHPSPPGPLETYMMAEIWVVRDANWSPDFPTSARAARDLYYLDQRELADGVIAADLAALQSLVRVLGPIRLEAYGVTVDGDNALDLMHRYWASPQGEGQSGDWWLHRKDFMGELLSVMLSKLESDLASLDLPALLNALGQALEEKHLLVHMEDRAVAEVLAGSGWDGALQSCSGDFLMVVDTNMGFNKVNPNVESALDYQVHINQDFSLQAWVTVSHRNRSSTTVGRCVQEARYDPTYREMMEGCYWDYLRVYVPEKAELLRGPELTLPEGSLRARDSGLGGAVLLPELGPAEAGKGVLGTFFVVPPGAERETVFEYQLPSDVLDRDGSAVVYRLLVQKQPGTLGIPLHVTVTLPAGWEVLSTRPQASSSTGATVEFQTSLLVDREFEIVFRRR